MPKIGTKREFAINKSVSMPLTIAEKVCERAMENNRSFSDEVTSLIRLGLQVIRDAEIREQEKAKQEAKVYLGRPYGGDDLDFKS